MFANLSTGNIILYSVSGLMLIGALIYMGIGFRNYFRPLSIFRKAEEQYVHARLVKKKKIIKKQKDRSKVQFASVKDYTVYEADFMLDDGTVITTTIGEWNYGRHHVGDTGTLGYKDIGSYGKIFCDFNIELRNDQEEVAEESEETIEE